MHINDDVELAGFGKKLKKLGKRLKKLVRKAAPVVVAAGGFGLPISPMLMTGARIVSSADNISQMRKSRRVNRNGYPAEQINYAQTNSGANSGGYGVPQPVSNSNGSFSVMPELPPEIQTKPTINYGAVILIGGAAYLLLKGKK